MPIGRMLSDAFRSHKAVQNAKRLVKGEGYSDSGLVFARDDGTMWDPDAFTSSYRKLVSDAGFPDMGSHTLRHTAATLMLAQGIHPKIVSERLSHSTVSLTLDTCSHAIAGLQEDAAEAIDRVLENASHKVSVDNSLTSG